MLRIIRGADCYWLVGERRLARVPLAGSTVDWRAFDRQTQLIQAADRVARADEKLLTVTVTIPPGSDFDVAAVLASCARRAGEDGATGLDFTVHCDQPDRHLDQFRPLLAGAHRIGKVAASMITSASALTPDCSAALERAGFRYVQARVDGEVIHDDRALARDLANLRRAATSRSLACHAQVALTNETAGAVDTLLKMLAEGLTASSLDISFALIDEPRPEVAEGARLPQRLSAGKHNAGSGQKSADSTDGVGKQSDSISELYLHALTAGFNLRLPRCHRCVACDTSDATGLALNAEGMPYDAGDTRCHCAEPDHLCATLTETVQAAVLSHLYAACSLAPY